MSNLEAVTTTGAIIGQVLVKLRTDKGLKQQDLAAAVNISPSTWSRIEHGESGLSIEQLRTVAKTLGVSPGLILEMVEAAEHQVQAHGVKLASSLGTMGSITMCSMAPGVGIAAAILLPVLGSTLGKLISGVLNNMSKTKKGGPRKP